MKFVKVLFFFRVKKRKTDLQSFKLFPKDRLLFGFRMLFLFLELV